jgi:DNA-binding transcriptional regulator YdaS (Cro superfamily)
MNIATQLIKSAVLIAGSQTKLAEVIGVSQPAVHKWVIGKTRPDARAAIVLENKFGVCRHKLRPDIFGDLPTI